MWANDSASLTTSEQIERCNATGRTPVVFIHGFALAFLVPLVLVVLCVASSPALAASNAVPYPNSMAAIGDLLTLDNPLASNPVDSWSTGTNPAVNSHYLRILAANPAIKGKIYNFTGEEIDLRAEAREVVAKRVDYVTIGPIEDETCNGTASAAKVAAKLDGTLRILTAGLPNARVLVTSTRDIARLILVLDQDKNLRGFPICQLQVERAPQTWRGYISSTSR